MVESRTLVKQPNFPVSILPLVVVLANLLHFLLALPVLFFFIWIEGITLGFTVALLPLVIVLQMAFTLSLAYFVATIHVFFRDTQHLVGVFLFLFFYLNPIFYPADAIPAQYQTLYRLNPILHLLEAYRAILLHDDFRSTSSLLLVGAASMVLLFAGHAIFRRASYRFAEEL